MNNLRIYGDIVAQTCDKASPEDICPEDVQAYIDILPSDTTDINIEIASMGGDVFAGLSICAMLYSQRCKGRKVHAVVTSIAASIASVIACACDDITMYDGSYIMLHLPWTSVMGNTRDMAKEIAVLDQCAKSMLKHYRTKINLTDEEIMRLMEDETWIDSDNASSYGLVCDISPIATHKLAAKYASKFNFAKLPKGLVKMENLEEKKDLEKVEVVEEEEDKKTTEDVVIEEKEEDEKIEKKEEETKTEDVEEEDKDDIIASLKALVAKKDAEIEEMKKAIADLETKIEETKTEDVEARVSGMQSKMAKKLDKAEKSYRHEIEAKARELDEVKAMSISLRERLDAAERDLSDMTSALKAKSEALATLNASVNQPRQSQDWRSLTGKDFWAFCRSQKLH